MKAVFESSRTFGLFTAYFDEELYRYAKAYYENHVFERSCYMYAVFGVTKVLENVEISQRNHLPYRDMQRFLEQDFAIIHEDKDKQLPDKFKPYFTGRLDVKFMSKEQTDFQIVSASDEEVKIEKPDWFNKDGVGYVIQSYIGELEFTARAKTAGKINLYLRGSDVRSPEDNSKRIPYWIDFTKFIVNDKIIFDKVIPVWHDKPYIYKMDVKAGEEIKIQVEWLPHGNN